MNAKEKKIIEKGYNCLYEKLGEENGTYFIDYVISNGASFAKLKEFSDALAEERRLREEAKKPPKKEYTPLTKEQFQNAIKEYSEYLDKEGIRYSNNQGFMVWVPKNDEDDEFFVEVRHDWDTKAIQIDLFMGTVLSDLVRPVRRIEKNIKKQFPDYEVYTEDYHGYRNEFSLYCAIDYNGAEDLHNHILKLAADANAAVEIAKEEVGEYNFE